MHLHSRQILNPIFAVSLTVLLLNDHLLKHTFPGWITGKLSDVTGIIVFVQFISIFTAAGFRKHIYLLTALLFSAWKSPLSQPLIDLWNAGITSFSLARVVDYTDLFCLLALLPLYYYDPPVYKLPLKREFITVPLSLLTLIAITATSRAPLFTDRVYVNEFVRLNMTEHDFFDQLTADSIHYTRDSVYVFGRDTFNRYVLSDVNVNGRMMKLVEIGVRNKQAKTEVYVHRAVLAGNAPFFPSNERKAYERLLKKYKADAVSFFDKRDE